MKRTKLMLGDNIESLKKLPENSVDSIVSDPPYGLSFMGKKWDYDVPSVEFWKEVYRVLKPGGHVLSFGGTRTYHRMTVNIEDAGFEIRDQIMWLYGSGFPKSHNIGIAIDKQKGLIGNRGKAFVVAGQSGQKDKDTGGDLPNPNTKVESYEAQNEWNGWGTALKPANEPICVARKPLSEKSVAENVLRWGTGGINVDGCRVGYTSEADKNNTINAKYTTNEDNKQSDDWGTKQIGNVSKEEGRFPANIILDKIAGELLDEQSGVSKSNTKPKLTGKEAGNMYHKHEQPDNNYKEKIYVGDYSDKGGASRFFYQAKVSKAERNMGLDGFEQKELASAQTFANRINANSEEKHIPTTKNTHPTVKPVSLMAYLCRLVTPPNGIVLDPFMGSGSTGISAQLEGFRFCGMELDKDYFKIAESRIENFEQYRKFLKK